MLALLIWIGRFMMVVAALFTVILPTVYGWFWGVGQDLSLYNYSQTIALTPNRLIFMILGFFTGLIAAGVVFGLMAAIYDIQIALHKIVDHQRSLKKLVAVTGDYQRTEPFLS